VLSVFVSHMSLLEYLKAVSKMLRGYFCVLHLFARGRFCFDVWWCDV
jgi:hypothetical protein